MPPSPTSSERPASRAPPLIAPSTGAARSTPERGSWSRRRCNVCRRVPRRRRLRRRPTSFCGSSAASCRNCAPPGSGRARAANSSTNTSPRGRGAGRSRRAVRRRDAPAHRHREKHRRRRRPARRGAAARQADRRSRVRSRGACARRLCRHRRSRRRPDRGLSHRPRARRPADLGGRRRRRYGVPPP
jgi:hypothetical protein